jgi:hypothetical protein
MVLKETGRENVDALGEKLVADSSKYCNASPIAMKFKGFLDYLSNA